MHIDGACHCGLVSFSAEVDPARVVVCHCTDCQVLSGAPLRASVVAPVQSFVLSGQTKTYIKVAQSGSKRALGCMTAVSLAALRFLAKVSGSMRVNSGVSLAAATEAIRG